MYCFVCSGTSFQIVLVFSDGMQSNGVQLKGKIKKRNLLKDYFRLFIILFTNPTKIFR